MTVLIEVMVMMVQVVVVLGGGGRGGGDRVGCGDGVGHGGNGGADRGMVLQCECYVGVLLRIAMWEWHMGVIYGVLRRSATLE